MVIDVEEVELRSGLRLEIRRSSYPGYMRVTEPTRDWGVPPMRGPAAVAWADELVERIVKIRYRSGWTVRTTVVSLEDGPNSVLVVETQGRQRTVPLADIVWLGTELDLPPGAVLV